MATFRYVPVRGRETRWTRGQRGWNRLCLFLSYHLSREWRRHKCIRSPEQKLQPEGSSEVSASLKSRTQNSSFVTADNVHFLRLSVELNGSHFCGSSIFIAQNLDSVNVWVDSLRSVSSSLSGHTHVVVYDFSSVFCLWHLNSYGQQIGNVGTVASLFSLSNKKFEVMRCMAQFWVAYRKNDLGTGLNHWCASVCVFSCVLPTSAEGLGRFG